MVKTPEKAKAKVLAPATLLERAVATLVSLLQCLSRFLDLGSLRFELFGGAVNKSGLSTTTTWCRKKLSSLTVHHWSLVAHRERDTPSRQVLRELELTLESTPCEVQAWTDPILWTLDS
eukprot:m.96086 g.96086  ORF g.96086 m.96086 type:complete len:119 (+) comp12350_c0_seq2:1059-1415(+)